MSQKNIKWIYAFLLLHYAVIALFISLAHYHETDCQFHDNCPACVWEIQARDTDSVTTQALASISDPDLWIFPFIHCEIHNLQSQFLIGDQGSRAPPATL